MPKNCKNCGAEMPEEAHFCLSCLTETEEKAVITANKASFFANKKRAIALIATVLLIIVLILICIFCFENKSPNSADNNENKTAVSTITQDDGSVITEYDDGSVETLEPDGTKITQETDGTVKTETPDGKTITEKPDGTTITETPDGTTVTEKPDGTVITEKPDGTTEVTEKPTEPTTEKPTEPSTNEPSTENTTEPTTENTTNKTENNPAINYEDFTFEYKTISGQKLLFLTKYNGNDEVVNVPGEYNGEPIYSISSNCFYRVKTCKKIIFNASDEYPPRLTENVIYQCDNLEEVVFNWNENKNPGYSQTIYDGFAGYCNTLSKVTVNNCDDYKIYDNALYYYENTKYAKRGWVLLQIWQQTEYHQPSWCNYAGTWAFQANSMITELYLNSTISSEYQISYFLLAHNLKAVYIDKNNQTFFDDNGIVYDRVNKKLAFYPLYQSNYTYHLLDGYTFSSYAAGGFMYNTYLKIFYIPKNCKIMNSDGKEFLDHTISSSHLSTIYIQRGNSDIDSLKSRYGSKVNITIYD